MVKSPLEPKERCTGVSGHQLLWRCLLLAPMAWTRAPLSAAKKQGTRLQQANQILRRLPNLILLCTLLSRGSIVQFTAHTEMIYVSAQAENWLCTLNESVALTARHPHLVTMLRLARLAILSAANQSTLCLAEEKEGVGGGQGGALRAKALDALSPLLTRPSGEESFSWSASATEPGETPAGVLWLAQSVLFSLGMYSEITQYVSAAVITSPQTLWFKYFDVLVHVTAHIDACRADVRAREVIGSALALSERFVSMPPAMAVTHIKALQPLLRAIAQLKASVDPTADPLLLEMESSVLLLLGRVMFMAGGKLRDDVQGGCLPQLVNAAKLNPHCGKAYCILGHLYSSRPADASKGARCYQKAIDLDPMNDDAGRALCQYLLSGGGSAAEGSSVGINEALAMLQRVTAVCSYAAWAFTLRGQILLFQHQHESRTGTNASFPTEAEEGAEVRDRCNEAIVACQVALELRPCDGASWFCLGYAYLAQANYNSAHKALLKVLVHGGSQDIKVLCLLGEVERRLGLMHSALERFAALLRPETGSSSDVAAGAMTAANPVAVQGAADVCHALAVQCLAAGWTDEAARYLRRGVAAADQVLGSTAVVEVTGPVTDEAAITKLRFRANFLIIKGKLCSLFYLCGILNGCTDGAKSVSIESLLSGAQSSVVSPVDAIITAIRGSICGSGVNEGGISFVNMLRVGEESLEEAAALLSRLETATAAELLAECWYDIGVARCSQLRLLQLLRVENMVGFDDILRSRSVDAFISGLQQSRHHAGCWNGLGYVYSVHGGSAGVSSEQFAPNVDAAVLYLVSAKQSQHVAAYNNLGLHLMKYCRCFIDQGHSQQGQSRSIEGLLKGARDCFSVVQLGGAGRVDGSEGTWVNVGLAYELEYNRGIAGLLTAESTENAENAATALENVLQSAFDAYSAAMEISKPPAALLLHCKSWLQLRKLAVPRLIGCGLEVVTELCPASQCLSGDVGCSTPTIVLHQVQHFAHRYLFHMPLDASAWCIHAWALEFRGYFSGSQCSLLLALECVLKQCGANSTAATEASQTDLVRYILRAYCLSGLKRCLSEGSMQSPDALALPPWAVTAAATGAGAVREVVQQYVVMTANPCAQKETSLNAFARIVSGIHDQGLWPVAVVSTVDEINSSFFSDVLQTAFSESCRPSAVVIFEMLLLLLQSCWRGASASAEENSLVKFAADTVAGVAQQICAGVTEEASEDPVALPALSRASAHVLQNRALLTGCFKALVAFSSAPGPAMPTAPGVMLFITAVERRAAAGSKVDGGVLASLRLHKLNALLVRVIAARAKVEGGGLVLPRGATRELLVAAARVEELRAVGVGDISEGVSPLEAEGATLGAWAAVELLKGRATATSGISAGDISSAKERGAEAEGEDEKASSGRSKSREDECAATAAKRAAFYDPASMAATLLVGLTHSSGQDAKLTVRFSNYYEAHKKRTSYASAVEHNLMRMASAYRADGGSCVDECLGQLLTEI